MRYFLHQMDKVQLCRLVTGASETISRMHSPESALGVLLQGDDRSMMEGLLVPTERFWTFHARFASMYGALQNLYETEDADLPRTWMRALCIIEPLLIRSSLELGVVPHHPFCMNCAFGFGFPWLCTTCRPFTYDHTVDEMVTLQRAFNEFLLSSKIQRGRRWMRVLLGEMLQFCVVVLVHKQKFADGSPPTRLLRVQLIHVLGLVSLVVDVYHKLAPMDYQQSMRDILDAISQECTALLPE